MLCLSVCLSGDGLCVVCVDVDECSDGGPCVNAVCVNSPGSYQCQCTQPGSTLDSTGTTCRGKLYCIHLIATPSYHANRVLNSYGM